jgi:hypothetical protein
MVTDLDTRQLLVDVCTTAADRLARDATATEAAALRSRFDKETDPNGRDALADAYRSAARQLPLPT